MIEHEELNHLDLYIRLDENNNPIDHPIFADNIKQVWPDFDFENLPPGWAKFIRTRAYPTDVHFHDEFKAISEPTYKWVDGVVKEVFEIRDMTDEEKENFLNDRKKYSIATAVLKDLRG